MTTRCPTTRGKYRCTKDINPDGSHVGDDPKMPTQCEARDGEAQSLNIPGPVCPTCKQPVPCT